MAAMNDDVWREVFVAGLKNAHGVEHQALALMDRQIERARNFTEVADQLRAHRVETETQITRLETLLGQFDESASGLKDAALSMSGTLAALGHTLAEDEILKNAFANFAFENFEVAAYKGLILLARHGSYSAALDPLNETLAEEHRMARWVDESLPALTEKFLRLKRDGENPSR
ncbi:ferritin-like domain-containing protein [Brevundimonas sp.]|uniref:ferritin-like domain-containing protein n=1 Tax=Brevundimonas sp. TaxID=1871086 RepID=UPI001993E97B|nr:ferritin-like domain-containing protein [Brevundimonas sp.]MBD3837023.1 ferritin-like domain-containing protein [Brevundimonas sp.]